MYKIYIMWYISDMKTARLFLNGRSQAVRLPKEFRFEGDEVYIRREGDDVILTPAPNSLGRWVRQAVREFSADYMTRRDQPQRAESRKAL